MDFNLQLQTRLDERTARRGAEGGVERIYSRRKIEQNILETFELIGGIQRLAMWANKEENYETFLTLMMRLAPKDLGEKARGAVIEYRSNVPASALNRPKEGAESEVAEEAEFTVTEDNDQ